MGSLISLICFIILFILVDSIILVIVSHQYPKENRIYNNTSNYNPLTKTYCYQVLKSREEILDILRLPNIHDEMLYDFDLEKLTIAFNKDGTTAKCQLVFFERKDYLFLKVIQLERSGPNGNTFYWMNSFWCKKINAIPIRYFESI